MAIVFSQGVFLWADLLTDLTGSGSDDGITTNQIAWAEDQNNWYYCTATAASSSTWTALATGGGAAGREGVLYNGNTFYMDAGDRSSYSGSGSDVTDLINSTTGTLNGVQIIDGHFNFNGTSDDIDFGVVVASETEDIFSDTGGSGGSVSFWVRPEADGGLNAGRIADTAGGTTTNGWVVRVDSQSGTQVDLTFLRGAGTTQGDWDVTAALEVGQWNHVVVLYRDTAPTTAPTIYVNAVAKTVNTVQNPVGAVGSDSGNSLSVGNSGSAGIQGWEGDLDVAIFYNRQLSADEVGQLYRVQQDRFRPSLIGVDASVATSDAVNVEIRGGDGGSTEGDGADVALQGGAGLAGNSNGGGLLYNGGDGFGTGDGGGVLAVFGDGGASGDGGSAVWNMGDGGGTVGSGGSWNVTTGSATASGSGGGSFLVSVGASVDSAGSAVVMTAGSTNAGVGGAFLLTANNGTTGGGDFTINSGNATVSGNGGIIFLQPGTGIDDHGFVDVNPDWDTDANHYIELSASGTNTANVTQFFTGSRNPNTFVTGFPGSLYLRGDSTDSTLYVNTTSGTSAGTDWTELGSGGSGTGNWSEETTQTTDATAGVTIATPIATVTDGTQHSVEVLITAEAGGGNTFFRRQVFTFYRDGGGAVQWTKEIDGVEARRGLTTATAGLSVSGNAVLVTATGEAATTITWLVQFRTTNTITSGGVVSTTGIVRETFDNRGAATTTGSATGIGDTVDFTIAAGAAYVSMQFLRVTTATGTCNDATIQFFRDAARTDEIYDAENKDTGTGNGWVDRNVAAMLGDDGSGLATNTMYGRITRHDAGTATFDVEAILWGVT